MCLGVGVCQPKILTLSAAQKRQLNALFLWTEVWQVILLCLHIFGAYPSLCGCERASFAVSLLKHVEAGGQDSGFLALVNCSITGRDK